MLDCEAWPTDVTTATAPPTSPRTNSPGHSSFPDCKFEHEMCGWGVEGSQHGEMLWLNTNTDELEEIGADHPRDDWDGKVLNTLEFCNTNHDWSQATTCT